MEARLEKTDDDHLSQNEECNKEDDELDSEENQSL